jgi:hypothetical protein
MLTIHQINPTLHVHSRLFCWVEHEITHDYVASLIFHKNHKDAIKFIDSNFDIKKTGNTEDTSDRAGFRLK